MAAARRRRAPWAAARLASRRRPARAPCADRWSGGRFALGGSTRASSCSWMASSWGSRSTPAMHRPLSAAEAPESGEAALQRIERDGKRPPTLPSTSGGTLMSLMLMRWWRPALRPGRCARPAPWRCRPGAFMPAASAAGPQRAGIVAVADQPAHGVVGQHQLVDAHAAVIARAAAVVAAAPALQADAAARIAAQGAPAFAGPGGAAPARTRCPNRGIAAASASSRPRRRSRSQQCGHSVHQALRQDGQQRIGEARGRARSRAAARCLRRRVGVQRREHQVAGERGLDGDARGLPASRISPIMMTSGSARRKVRASPRRRSSRCGALTCTWRSPSWVISTVLGRPDLAADGVDVAQHRMQRGGLCRSRWGRRPGSGRGAFGDHRAQRGRASSARPIPAPAPSAWCPPSRRSTTSSSRARSAPVTTRSSTAGPPKRAKSILPSCGLRCLGDVEVGHDLDARDDGEAQPRRHFQHWHQVAVDAHAHRAPGAARRRSRCGCRRRCGAPPRSGVDQAHQRVVRSGGHRPRPAAWHRPHCAAARPAPAGCCAPGCCCRPCRPARPPA